MNSQKIIRFPSRQVTRRACRSCGAPFIPTRAYHCLCSDCWRWARIGRNVAETARLLREAGS